MIDIDFIYCSPYFDIAKKYNFPLQHVTCCNTLYFTIGNNVYSLRPSEYLKFKKYYSNLQEMYKNGDFTEQEIDAEIVRIISNNSDHYHVIECENSFEFENKIKNIIHGNNTMSL
jgi:hypothetical protein